MQLSCCFEDEQPLVSSKERAQFSAAARACPDDKAGRNHNIPHQPRPTGASRDLQFVPQGPSLENAAATPARADRNAEKQRRREGAGPAAAQGPPLEAAAKASTAPGRCRDTAAVTSAAEGCSPLPYALDGRYLTTCSPGARPPPEPPVPRRRRQRAPWARTH